MDSLPPPPPSSSSSSIMEPTSFVSHPLMSPSSTMLAPATARFPYHHVPPPSLSSVMPSEPFTTASVVTTTIPYDGSLNSSALNPSGPAKKKRGRPRKYSLDGNVALGLAPTSSTGHGGDNGGGSGGGGGDLSGTLSTEAPVKRPRGRPPGSGKKQLDAHGAGAVGFKHHVIFVNSGEDITEKVMACSQQGTRIVCVLSARGLVTNVTLRQPPLSGRIVSHEGQFEIISLSSSFPQSGNNGEISRTSYMNVVMTGSDGLLLAGGVVGALTAASPIQIVVGSFIPNKKQSSSNVNESSRPSSSAPTSSQMLTFGGSVTQTIPTPQGPSSESSDENDHSSFRGPGLYNNVTQPITNNMQMFQHPLWPDYNNH
ncbi:hypothetical protein TanjilG_28058 [Lupinus angustifolius]|uniref:AT-hook motif nuclear-localized protein n=1 Tax=Lupinus angustifolius TaxID=3871 RepID=A0A4P1RGA3_LUPAN|nr:PREDICTED: AT-hook motif nuclear-localized protein 8-like [Lupinus angustifolius]OIW10307.1 hypothetical protein TanjilG_28058 [Lupinus angustifolius]